MDLGAWANVIAIMGGISAGVVAVVGGAVWIGGWMARREQDHDDFTDADTKVGRLADNSTVALRDLERKVDEHIREDSGRFIQIAESLGRIEGALGTRRH